MAVGAPTESSKARGVDGDQADNSAANAGATYVFTRAGSTWTQRSYLKGAQTDAGDLFGFCVDLSSDGNTLGPAEINGEPIDRLIGWCMTYLINFIGYPAASVPAGLAENGLPVGMQIVGRRYADADVISASAAFERLRPWMRTYERCRI